MPGFVSSFSNNLNAVFANNADFSGSATPSDVNGLQTDNQIWIGSTAVNAGGTHVNVKTLTAGTGVTFSSTSSALTINASGGVSTVTAGANINLTGTATNPIINLNTQVLQPNGNSGAPPYSFTNNTAAGIYYTGGSTSISGGFGQGFDVGFTVSSLALFQVGAGMTLTYTNPGAYPYTALTSDLFISVDTSGGAHTVSFPNAPRLGQVYIVKDRTGNAFTNNITVTSVGGVITIDGATTYLIDLNYASASFIFNGTNYEVF